MHKCSFITSFRREGFALAVSKWKKNIQEQSNKNLIVKLGEKDHNLLQKDIVDTLN